MPAKRVLGMAVVLVLVILVGSLILGSLLGQPLLLSYVDSGSMEPTLGQGDGFIALPMEIAGSPEVGDVVVFRAEEVGGGGLTTHRIIGVSDNGYLTQGDANTVSDQKTGEPPVKPEQIVAVAWQLNGNVVVIPNLGAVVQSIQGILEWIQLRLASLFNTGMFLGIQGLGYLLFGVTIVVYVIDWLLRSGQKRSRQRSRESGQSARLLVGMLAMAIVIAATAAMLSPAGPNQFDIISSSTDSERSNVIERGTSETRTFVFRNSGQLPVRVFLQTGSENIDFAPREFTIERQSSRNVSITFTAPPETGLYRYFLSEYRYLAILPEGYIRGLYEIHPWVPVLVIDALLGIPFYLIGISLLGSGRVRKRTRAGPGFVTRLLARFN